LDADLLDAMRRLQERDGISLSEQARRSLRPWLEAKGVLKPKRVRAQSWKRTWRSTRVSASSAVHRDCRARRRHLSRRPPRLHADDVGSSRRIDLRSEEPENRRCAARSYSQPPSRDWPWHCFSRKNSRSPLIWSRRR